MLPKARRQKRFKPLIAPRQLLYFIANSSAHLVGPPAVSRYLSAPPRRHYRGNVNFLHRHHPVERAFGRHRIGAHHRVGEGSGGDLPRQAPAVFAPAALAFLLTIAFHKLLPFRSPG